MHGSTAFLTNLAMVLCVAALTTVIFQRLRQPVVLGYLIAGLIIGPHVPVPLVADAETIHTLAELGVILLMFSIGLEFNLRKLARIGPTAGLVAVIQVGIMLWLGYVTARGLGWTTLEGLFTGAAISISSTTIIAKAFDERGIKGRLRELVFGVLIIEDLIAILLLAILTGVGRGTGLSAVTLGVTVGRLVGVLAALLVGGLFLIPRAVRLLVRLDRAETTLIGCIGICFACALIAQSAGYSVALGAFLAGALVAESGAGPKVERLVEPVRDVFAAIFFVAVGMMIDPAVVVRHWAAVLLLTSVVVAGKVIGVTIGAFLSGAGTRGAVRAGMSLAQIGEFSFIIAGLGLSLNATSHFLYPVIVTVSAITTLLTPWLIRASEGVAAMVDRKLPRRLQTFAALYESWLERLRARATTSGERSRRRLLARKLLLDSVVLAAVVVGGAIGWPHAVHYVTTALLVPAVWTKVALAGGIILAASPFALGTYRCVRTLGGLLALDALPGAAAGATDLSAAPRRSLQVALQLALFLAVAGPLLALTTPLLPHGGALAVVVILLVLLLPLTLTLWRSTADLHGHVRAGAEMLVEALASQAQAGREPAAEGDLVGVGALMAGLGTPVRVVLAASSAGVGKRLGELDVRARTGATVLAITRQAGAVVMPSGSCVLHAGDALAIGGTPEAVHAARALLLEGTDEPSD